MTLLNAGLAPFGSSLVGGIQDALCLLLIGTRHLTDEHIARLRTVIVFHTVVIIEAYAAYLCRQEVSWLPTVESGLVTCHLTIALPLGKDLLHPLLIDETVEVGIGLVEHLVHRLHAFVRQQAVLVAGRLMRQRVLHVVGIDELLLEILPLLRVGSQRERVCQEIVWSSILVHTAHQIADGIQEVFLLHHRGIEYHMIA